MLLDVFLLFGSKGGSGWQSLWYVVMPILRYCISLKSTCTEGTKSNKIGICHSVQVPYRRGQTAMSAILAADKLCKIIWKISIGQHTKRSTTTVQWKDQQHLIGHAYLFILVVMHSSDVFSYCRHDSSAWWNGCSYWALVLGLVFSVDLTGGWVKSLNLCHDRVVFLHGRI